MPKKINKLQEIKNMCDSNKFSEGTFINSATTSVSQKLKNTCSDSEINHLNQIPEINEIDLLRLNRYNKFSTFAEGIKENKQLQNIQCVIESNLSDCTKQKICHILSEVSSLSAQEKLFLYLRLPPENVECDPLRQPQNPLGSRSEINDTITWVRSHLKHDPKVSIPKQDVYSDYTAYCDRLDIKPLSTADFGKVMKQVFPEIKPRRLGTRGHSRYCYAAMRKATKLTPPSLPKTRAELNPTYVLDEINNDTWPIIKMWSEELLNSTFQSLSELAAYISKNQSNNQTNNSSKMLFQKKKLQREIKSKRKYSESVSSKKRRKKKVKICSYPESFQRFKNPATVQSDKLNLKMQSTKFEIEHGEKVSNLDIISSQSVPINLTSDDKSCIFGCEKTINYKVSGDLIQKGKSSPPCSLSKHFENTDIKDIKQECVEEYSSNILCKKVRQAQQSKGLWVPPSLDNPVLNSQHYANNNNFLMGPPAQIQSHSLPVCNSNLNDVPGNRKSVSAYNQEPSVLSKNHMQLSAKKNRCAQNKHECQLTDSENIEDDKNILPENLGLPRERVISICNMDKHELDDYLIGENSQDQEAELLQYFHSEEGNETGNDVSIKASNPGNPAEDASDILQLRSYLHQNFQNNRFAGNQTDSKLQTQQTNPYMVPYAGGLASASLAIMSQRHLSNRLEHSDGDKFGPRRKLNLNSRPGITLNNPNIKRKQFSFVPIPLSSHVSNDKNHFISPKSKLSVQKSNVNKQKFAKSSADFNISDPMIGAIQAAENVASASAPSSPCISQQRFQALNSPHTFNLGNSFPQNVNNNVTECNFNEIVEYRSRSVPLHINTSPEFNKNDGLSGFLSTCNSVTPTPIPTEFSDFNEPLLDFFTDPNIEQANQIDVSLLDMNIPFANRGNESRNKYINIEKSEILNYTSRSNPCTPLPNNMPTNNLNIDIFANIKLNENNVKLLDSSKSVPTTPCGFTGNQFRYSPEINRDCLINGNTVDRNVNCYPRLQLKSINIDNSMNEIAPVTAINNDEIGTTTAESIINPTIYKNL